MKPQHFVCARRRGGLVSLGGDRGLHVVGAVVGRGRQRRAALPDAQGRCGRRSSASRSARARRRSRSSATGDQWRLQNRDSYPATPEKIRALIANLTDAELAEPKTRSPAAVRAPRARGSQGPECQLASRPAPRRQGRRARRGDRRQEALGRRRLGKAGTYVRKPGDEQTWLATADISGGTGLRDWTKARIFETAPDKITKLRIELPGEAGLRHRARR